MFTGQLTQLGQIIKLEPFLSFDLKLKNAEKKNSFRIFFLSSLSLAGIAHETLLDVRTVSR